jgi:hypothetical protein
LVFPIKPFIKTKLISPLGKLRAGLDLFKKPIEIEDDISVGDFFRQRLGSISIGFLNKSNPALSLPNGEINLVLIKGLISVGMI